MFCANIKSGSPLVRIGRLLLLIAIGTEIALAVGDRPGVPMEPPVQFTLDWTHAQVHYVNDGRSIILLLHGRIASPVNVIWMLSGDPSLPSNPTSIALIETPTGSDPGAGEIALPLHWDISIDGGTFVPISEAPNGNLHVGFSPGFHQFQVQMTSTPSQYQMAGYYRLRLGESLAGRL